MVGGRVIPQTTEKEKSQGGLREEGEEEVETNNII